MRLPNDKLEDILIWMCLDACNKKLRVFYVMKKIYCYTLEGLSKEGSSQVGEFSSSMVSSRIHVLSVLILFHMSWIDFISRAALLVDFVCSSMETDKLYERRGTTLSSLPFKGVEERGDRHFSQKPPECSMSLLTRLVHVLILRLSTDKQEETITASQRSTRSYGRLLNKIHVLGVGKSSLDICWVGTTFKMRQRKTMGDKLQRA